MKLILAALALLVLVLWSRREPEAVEDWTHPSLDIFRRRPEPWPLYREGDDGLPPVEPRTAMGLDHDDLSHQEGAWTFGCCRCDIQRQRWEEQMAVAGKRWQFGEPVRR